MRDVNEYSYNAGNGKFSPVNAAMQFPNRALVRFSSKNRNDQVNGILPIVATGPGCNLCQ